MSSKTKIVVLHMKEIIYTVIFAVLAIVLILLIFMFRPENHRTSNEKKIYTPGIYTSDITLNNTALEVEVTVDETHINSIRFSNLNDSITTMYPFIEPAIEDIATRSIKNSLLRIFLIPPIILILPQMIVKAIENALKKAETTK